MQSISSAVPAHQFGATSNPLSSVDHADTQKERENIAGVKNDNQNTGKNLNRLDRSALSKLAANQLNKLNSSQLAKLDAKQLNKLGPAQLNKLSGALLNKLGAKALLKLNNSQLGKLNGAQLAKLPDAKLKRLNPQILKKLSAAKRQQLDTKESGVDKDKGVKVSISKEGKAHQVKRADEPQKISSVDKAEPLHKNLKPSIAAQKLSALVD